MTTQPKRSSAAPEARPADSTSIPHSLIEHQYLFTPAEMRLAVIILMRPGMPLSDDDWTKMTGLDAPPIGKIRSGARTKELAEKGLREKGLEVETIGKGKAQRSIYRFNLSRWETYFRNAARTERARTSGRAPTAVAKPGMMVHEACKDKCQKLCDETAKCDKAEVISISSAVATPTAKYISETKAETSRPSAKYISGEDSQVVDGIETQLGNVIPQEHIEAVTKVLSRAHRRIHSEATNNPKALEAHIIKETVAKLAKPKAAVHDRTKEIETAHKILNWEQNHAESQRAEMARAREILASPPRENKKISAHGKSSVEIERAERAERLARDQDQRQREIAQEIIDTNGRPPEGKPTEKEKQWARDVIAGSGQ